MKKPTISLITTTYNRWAELEKLAPIIANQTYKDFEWVLFIDQGENFQHEEYDRAIQNISIRYPDIRLNINGWERVGRAKALKLAHDAAQGKYIGVVDDDDWLATTTLEKCIEPKADFVYTDFYELRGDQIRISNRNKRPYSYEYLFQFNNVFHFRLYKKSLYLKAGGIDISYDTTMDYELTLRMLALVEPVKINQPLYYYNLHDDRISKKYSDRQRKKRH
jgi:glycosyltransferase involved in cell wall biosynthesis